jgi:RNA 2',3'-cyclic 3'-phosphodiesterase
VRVIAGRSRTRAAPASIRGFVALQPDEAARERLDQLAGEQHARFPSARRMRRENLHLTLAFIGALDADLAQQVAAHLAAERAEPFTWSLDAVGAFGGAGVLWAGGSDAQLGALAARSRRLLDELGVRFDRKPFVAHVTLLRKVPREAAREAAHRIEPPILWQAGTPVLLESKTDAQGARYTPVAVRTGND